MGISLGRETKIGLADVARELDVTRTTVHRWVHVGIRGHRLEAYRQVGRMFTSREALARFLVAVESAREQDPIGSGQRVRYELRDHGLLEVVL